MTIVKRTRTRHFADPTPALVSTARTTGFLYLAMAVAGGLGFLLIRP